MKINVHAGHAAVGKGAIGAVGILNESKEDRSVKELVIKKLKMLGPPCMIVRLTPGMPSRYLPEL